MSASPNSCTRRICPVPDRSPTSTRGKFVDESLSNDSTQRISDETDRDLRRRNLEQPRPGRARDGAAPTDERDEARTRGQAAHGRRRRPGGVLRRRPLLPRTAGQDHGRGIRARRRAERPRPLSIDRLQLRARRRAVLVRLQPWRVHGPYARGVHEQGRADRQRRRLLPPQNLRVLRTKPCAGIARVAEGVSRRASRSRVSDDQADRRLGHGRRARCTRRDRPNRPQARREQVRASRRRPARADRERVSGARDRRAPRAVQAEPLAAARGLARQPRAGLVPGRAQRHRRQRFARRARERGAALDRREGGSARARGRLRVPRAFPALLLLESARVDDREVPHPRGQRSPDRRARRHGGARAPNRDRPTPPVRGLQTEEPRGLSRVGRPGFGLRADDARRARPRPAEQG